jgi:hypothetical protein
MEKIGVRPRVRLTGNKKGYMQNMSIERVIFVCFNSALFKAEFYSF